MSKEDRYFQFPLWVLSYGKDVRERMDDLIGWCVMDAGRKARLSVDESVVQAKIASQSMPADFNEELEDHISVMLGLSMLNVSSGSVLNIIREWTKLEQHIRHFDSIYGTSPFVRIRSDLFWEGVNDARQPGCGFSWREFSVLCAVYSIVGDKPFMRVIHDRIVAASLGYKSVAVMKMEPRHRKDKAVPLTESQIKTTLTKLEADGWFIRLQTSPRKVFFSHRLSVDELQNAIFARETRRPARIITHRNAARELRQKIKAVRDGIVAGPSSNDNHAVTQ